MPPRPPSEVFRPLHEFQGEVEDTAWATGLVQHRALAELAVEVADLLQRLLSLP